MIKPRLTMKNNISRAWKNRNDLAISRFSRGPKTKQRGQGPRCRDVICLTDQYLRTSGAGIGAGIVIDGRLLRGATGTAGEIGHTTLDERGILCYCGNRGCLETMASATWTVDWVKKQLAQGASSWLRELWEADPDALRGETLVAAALQRDPLAGRAFDRVGRSLGLAIAAVAHLLGITRGIIGGRFARFGPVEQQVPVRVRPHIDEAGRAGVGECRPRDRATGSGRGLRTAASITSATSASGAPRTTALPGPSINTKRMSPAWAFLSTRMWCR